MKKSLVVFLVVVLLIAFTLFNIFGLAFPYLACVAGCYGDKADPMYFPPIALILSLICFPIVLSYYHAGFLKGWLLLNIIMLNYVSLIMVCIKVLEFLCRMLEIVGIRCHINEDYFPLIWSIYTSSPLIISVILCTYKSKKNRSQKNKIKS